MLKYSRAAFGIIKEELTSISFFVTMASSVMMMAYLLYATLAGSGVLGANIALCSVTAVNLISYILMHRAETRGVKEARSWIKHTCKITKLCINAVSLATMVYAVVTTPDQVSTITLVLLPLMIIFWALQAILEVVTLYVKSRIDLFYNGIQMDFDYVIAPLAKVKSVVGAVMGEEPVASAPVGRYNEQLLKRRAAQDAAERSEKRKHRVKAVVERILPKRGTDDKRAGEK